MNSTKGITPDKAKRRPNSWEPSPVKKAPIPMNSAPKKTPYRKQGR